MKKNKFLSCLLISAIIFSFGVSNMSAEENLDEDTVTHVITYQQEYNLDEMGEGSITTTDDWIDYSLGQTRISNPVKEDNYLMSTRLDFTINQIASEIAGYRFVRGRVIIIPTYLSLNSQNYDPQPNPNRFGSPMRMDANGNLIFDQPLMNDHMTGKNYDFDTVGNSMVPVSGIVTENIRIGDTPRYNGMAINSVGENIPTKTLNADEYALSLPFDFQGLNSENGIANVGWFISTQFPNADDYPEQLFVGNRNQHMKADILLTLEKDTTITLTRPKDYTINLGESVTLDSKISCEDSDGLKGNWYGTFQMRTPGNDEWTDVNTEFMSTLVENTDENTIQTHSYVPPIEHHGTEFRYKYVHGVDTSLEVYSNPGHLYINQPTNPTEPDKPKVETTETDSPKQKVEPVDTNDSTNRNLYVGFMAVAFVTIIALTSRRLYNIHSSKNDKDDK